MGWCKEGGVRWTECLVREQGKVIMGEVKTEEVYFMAGVKCRKARD